MNKRKRFLMVAVLLIVGLMASGCYWNKQVEENEVGLDMPDGVKISRVVGPGRYTKLGSWYAELVTINASALTIEWNDPDLVTSDKQPIGFSVSVTFSRKRDSESITTMWEDYNTEARNDEALKQQVLARCPRVAKAITAKYSLDEMLGITEGTSRTDIQNDFFEALEGELAEIHVRLLDVGINNISPSETYLAALEEKATAQIKREVAAQNALLKQEELKQEEAETQIALEKARRARQVEEERAKVYELSPELYELRRIELLQGVLGDKDKVYFVPQGADITLFLSGLTGDTESPPVPVPTSPTITPVEPTD